jgi:hypothetical protein
MQRLPDSTPHPPPACSHLPRKRGFRDNGREQARGSSARTLAKPTIAPATTRRLAFHPFAHSSFPMKSHLRLSHRIKTITPDVTAATSIRDILNTSIQYTRPLARMLVKWKKMTQA